MASATSVTLTGGALAKNVFWQVAGQATFGANSHFEGSSSRRPRSPSDRRDDERPGTGPDQVALQQATITQPAP